MATDTSFDLVVVGAGIIGLAAAYAARQRGLRVAVVERHARCIGASVRNFGFVTVTGQRRGEHWQRARRTREVWEQVVAQAGIEVLHRGAYFLARRPQARDVMDAFLRTDMGEGCRILGAAEAARDLPMLQPGHGVLYSPHECRMESREALPRLARWLEAAHGVAFFWNRPVLGISLPQIHTSQGVLHAAHAVVCPGHDLHTLYPEMLTQARIRLCTLQMLRVMPAQPMTLPGAVLSDLSLARYDGFTGLAEAGALQALIQTEQAEHLRHGVHLIAVQSADGSLVVGDSHVYGDSEVPFQRDGIDDLILGELHRVLRVRDLRVVERWAGTYASSADVVYKTAPAPGVAVGLVTGGTGASTSFAFGEELVALSLGA